MNLTPLEGQNALITGSTSGIGEAIARRLADGGAHVLISGRDRSRGELVVSAINADGGHASFVAADLAAAAPEIRAFAAEATAAASGRLDILVLNAGIYPVSATESLADEDLDAMLAVNIRAPHVLVGQIAPVMADHGAGVIVMVSSWMARVGSPVGAMYSATKAADEQLARSWAAEYGPRGVRVNAIAPGVTLTPGNAAYRPVLDTMTAQTPAGEVVLPEHIAASVAFLSSPDAAMIYGQTLFVDGGISTTRLS